MAPWGGKVGTLDGLPLRELCVSCSYHVQNSICLPFSLSWALQKHICLSCLLPCPTTHKPWRSLTVWLFFVTPLQTHTEVLSSYRWGSQNSVSSLNITCLCPQPSSLYPRQLLSRFPTVLVTSLTLTQLYSSYEKASKSRERWLTTFLSFQCKRRIVRIFMFLWSH